MKKQYGCIVPISVILFIALVTSALSFNKAEAQSQRNPCFYAVAPSNTDGCTAVSTSKPLPVTASVNVSGFAPATVGTPISVTTGGVSGTLPAGTVVVATNVGTTNAAYCKLGASATTSDQYISPNGGWFSFTVGAATQLTCITSTSTTTVNMTGGSGIATGTGGGSGGGGGGGGAVTIADGANVVEGSLADAAATAGGTGTFAAKFRLMTTQLNTLNTSLGTINTTLASPFQAGGSIGNTTFGATQTGIWTVQPGNTANTTAWLVTGTGGTFPVTQATSSNLKAQVDPLTVASWAIGATGAAVPANAQLTGFSDGTNTVAGKVGAVANVASAAGFMNMIGIAQYNATPLTVTDTRYQSLQSDINGFLKVNVATATGLAQGSTTSGQTGSMIMGAVTTANPSYTTAQTAYASLDIKGNVRTVLGGGVPITASATGTTGATTATLATSASVTTYICGFSIRANATAVATNNATVTGTITGTMNFTQWTAPNASGLGVTEEIFSPCIPASAANTSIAVVSGAPGTGGVVSVSAWGYQQ